MDISKIIEWHPKLKDEDWKIIDLNYYGTIIKLLL
jgi:hypothetical protein